MHPSHFICHASLFLYPTAQMIEQRIIFPHLSQEASGAQMIEQCIILVNWDLG
jgi:hypothetical protein